ncbi:hypothetical protein GMORB2_3220 [Geosmithia morbida]|uniref:Carbohydrate-binding domain-containing protein n=1 Tax=Geosmithia morbida TaxID=1094350 RepID=A0A9P4YSX8_9HYPO|nr:uncharacterized protein GMORB2_3220 [Geosmithia morbida]KAF4120419.1 hypothetical protein GMORB2_3220 [Geosmithia morbida]
MRYYETLMLLVATSGLVKASHSNASTPSVQVPACPIKGTITYTKSVPSQTDDFALTQVDLCYTANSLSLTLTAYNETNFYFDASQEINDDIWEYEVMEAFIYQGTDDPQTYLEFEINPNNVTYQAFVFNPTKTRADGAPFDHFFVSDPKTDGFKAATILNRPAKIWTSEVSIPLALFNVDDGAALGTEWRMQFLRTITSPDTYPGQELGAWSPPNEANFHITKYMGHAVFI